MLKELLTPEDLIPVAKVQGVHMTSEDAEVVLGYLAGHGYSLAADPDGLTYRLDLEVEGSEEEAYTIENALYFCYDMNDDFLQECDDDVDEDLAEKIKKGLEHDREILDLLLDQIYRRDCYEVTITEVLQRTVRVSCGSAKYALALVEERYRNEEIVLSSEDYANTEFRLTGHETVEEGRV